MKKSFVLTLAVTLFPLFALGCGGEIISETNLSAEDPVESPDRLPIPEELELAVTDALLTLNNLAKFDVTELAIVAPEAVSFGAGVGGAFIHIQARLYAKFANGEAFLSRDFALSGHSDSWQRENGWLTEAGLRDFVVHQVQKHWQETHGQQPEAALTAERAQAWQRALENTDTVKERIYVSFLYQADQVVTEKATNGAYAVGVRVERLNLGEGTRALSVAFSYMPNPPFEKLATFELGVVDASFINRAPVEQIKKVAFGIVSDGVAKLLKANPELVNK